MSERLQQLVVRMCFDPAFANDVRSDKPMSLSITEQERTWLRTLSDDALKADSGRRDRLLLAVHEEAPMTKQLIDARNKWDEFFRSNEWVSVIEQRGATVVAACTFAVRTLGSSFAAIELMMARLRRRPIDPSTAATNVAAIRNVALGARFATLLVSEGTLQAYQAQAASVPSGREECLLFERHSDERMTIELAPEGLKALFVELMHGPISLDKALAVIRTLAPDDDPNEILGSLVADGLLQG